MGDYSKLRALAQKQANPANWFQPGEVVAGIEPEDLEYIAAANPAAVLELLVDEQDATELCDCLSELLYGVAVVLRGPGEPLKRHGFSDLPSRVERVVNERDQLKLENERLQRIEHAFNEFIDKTEWVQATVKGSELGMHRADVLRKRCEDLTSQCQVQADQLRALGQPHGCLAQGGHGLREDPGAPL
ncbi:MAG: hypothetical protein EON56_00580 [Alphaproteobacteria bacterium]|nr:MAG: hypothetical protein EON56_00580 [Alphaproteobacteria bacterium]